MYKFKEVEKEDLYDFLCVNTYSWSETYRGIINDDFLDKGIKELDLNVERLKNRFDKQKIEEPDYKRFLLYVDNKPVGNVSVCKSREEKYPDSGELCSLYLLKEYQKYGYGKIMFEKAKEELKRMNYKDMIIYCIDGNKTNEFYKHMGGKFIYSKKRNIGGSELLENVYYYETI